MKKVLAIMLGIVLCLGVVMMTGCGVFDGNYKEINAEKMEEIVAKVILSEDGDNFNFEKYCYDVYGESKGEGKEGDQRMESNGKFEMKTALVDGKGEGTSKIEQYVKLNSKENKLKIESCLKGGTLYVKNNLNGTEKKVKSSGMFVDDMLGLYAEYVEELFPFIETNLESTYDMCKKQTGVKYYFDDTDKEFDKVKIVVEQKVDAGEIKMEHVYLYGKTDYALRGYKMNIYMNEKSGNDYSKIDSKIEFKPFSGSLSFPGDLDTY